ncbi:sugar porter family MFS transporter [Corynebacterium caspium]|uniref:sugar porter family MFS transporter n=1 Tax=Corynebacterium caspium TaxID=234828 RepID=UPI0003A9A681|nr:sugar porter family MFS transporter [Corynebacterium caspium]WKD58780.1 Major myo-inositol transporter IolT [Corynebacterium caspium DSM 44850]
MNSRRYVATVALVAAFGGLLFGYDTGVMSGALLYLSPEFGLTPAQEGWVTSTLLIGAAIGALSGARIADGIGRRMTLILGGLIFIGGSLWCAFAGGPAQLATARALLGVAVGAVSIVVPMYISEKVPPAVRGKLVSLNSLMIVIGQLVAYLVNSSLAHTGSWRAMLGLAAVPGVILTVGMLFLPDTPMWYARRGLMDKAREAAAKVGMTLEELGVGANSLNSNTNGDQAGVREQLRRLRSVPWVRSASITAIGVGITQQVTGVNAIVYFAPTLMHQVGIPTENAVHTAILIGAVSVVACYVGLRIVDRVGRRRLLLIGLVGNTCALVILAVAYSYAERSTAIAFLALGIMALFIAFQQAAVSLTTWLLISELIPSQVRGVGMGLAGLGLWGANWVVAQFFLPMVSWLSAPWTFIVFAGCGVIALIFVLRRVPETSGQTLDEVGEAFVIRYGK